MTQPASQPLYPLTQHGFTPVGPPSNPLQLSYTLRLPSASPPSLALIAHPLGRLGGTKEDPVVLSLSSALLEQGWGVLTYDARGAGSSSGRASFSCVPLLPLPPPLTQDTNSGIPETTDYETLLSTLLLPLHPTHLLLAGYSYGTLSASLTPPPRGPKTSYLLLSYPLGVLWALTAFRASPFVKGLEERARSEERVLLVWGDGDQFTGCERYREWAEGLRAVGSGVECLEVEGADHLWGSRGGKREMLEGVMRWLAEEGVGKRAV